VLTYIFKYVWRNHYKVFIIHTTHTGAFLNPPY